MIIKKVYENKITGQKLICIPKKDKEIKEGDYVKIVKIKETEETE